MFRNVHAMFRNVPVSLDFARFIVILGIGFRNVFVMFLQCLVMLDYRHRKERYK